MGVCWVKNLFSDPKSGPRNVDGVRVRERESKHAVKRASLSQSAAFRALSNRHFIGDIGGDSRETAKIVNL